MYLKEITMILGVSEWEVEQRNRCETEKTGSQVHG